MWQEVMLAKLGAEDLASKIEDALSAENLMDSNGDAAIPDFNERCWLYKLWEIHPDHRLLERRVKTLADSSQKSADVEYFLNLWSALPHNLVQSHWFLIKKAAVAYHKTMELDNEHYFNDLISVGHEALLVAAKRYFFQPKGTFKNFAWNFLRTKMKEDQQQRHPVPIKVRKKLWQLDELRVQLRLKGIPETKDELAKGLQLDQQHLHELLEVEGLWGSGGDLESEDTFDDLEEPDLSPSALSLLIQREDRVMIESALENLPHRSQVIILGLYFEDKSLRDLADEFGVPLNSLKKAHKKALQDLKFALGLREA